MPYFIRKIVQPFAEFGIGYRIGRTYRPMVLLGAPEYQALALFQMHLEIGEAVVKYRSEHSL